MSKKHKHVIGQDAGSFKNAVFGVEDGLVSTLGVVIGATGGGLGKIGVLVAGFAAAITGAISMAAGTYISTKSEIELFRKEIDVEKEEIRTRPKQEKIEIRQFYRQKGFDGKLLDQIVNHIVSDRKLMLKTMLREELGINEKNFEHPSKDAVSIFLFFILGSIVPLIPFMLFEPTKALTISPYTTGLGLFLAGAAKSKLTKRNWIKSGIEMLLIGLLAGGAGYLIGNFVSHYLGIMVL